MCSAPSHHRWPWRSPCVNSFEAQSQFHSIGPPQLALVVYHRTLTKAESGFLPFLVLVSDRFVRIIFIAADVGRCVDSVTVSLLSYLLGRSQRSRRTHCVRTVRADHIRPRISRVHWWIVVFYESYPARLRCLLILLWFSYSAALSSISHLLGRSQRPHYIHCIAAVDRDHIRPHSSMGHWLVVVCHWYGSARHGRSPSLCYQNEMSTGTT